MLQSNHLFKLLSAVIILFCVYAFSAGVNDLEVSPAVSLRKKLKEIYTSQIGVRELTGRNDGARVETYLRYVGLVKGSPWCASFICWSLGQAGISNPRSGWSPDLLPDSKLVWTRSRGLIKKGLEPRAGDVFGIWFPEKGRVGHVGFVDEWSDKYLISVEGNTNAAGGSKGEGDGVFRKRRLISSIYKVADYVGGKGE